MRYFISDTHFGHESILKECRPQFAGIQEMNEYLIERINQKTTRADTLYIVGDFAYRSKTSPVAFLEAIKPKKVLILGNHDRDWVKKLTEAEMLRLFADGTVHDALSLKKDGLELHVQHFPQLSWHRSHYWGQSVSVCGHIHNARAGRIDAELFPLVRTQFNAGVDINNFEPVTMAELMANNTAFYHRTYTEEEQALLDRFIHVWMT